MDFFKYVNCGLYVVSSENSGCVINTLTQVNSKDPLVTISVNTDNYTNKIIKKNMKFAVSILNTDVTMDLISEFGFKSSKYVNKFENVKYKFVDNTSVLTENAIGYIICDVIKIVDCDTHDLFIGKVINSEVLNDGNPITYEYYHKVLKGSTPPKAPSFIKVQKNKESSSKKYQCIICGHVYDDGVETIKFEDLPDNWVCPKCRVGKDKFRLVD